MWQSIGYRLELGAAPLENIKQKSDDNVQRCSEVFNCWITSNGHRDYPLTWDGLFELLLDVDRSTAVEKLKQALAKTA